MNNRVERNNASSSPEDENYSPTVKPIENPPSRKRSDEMYSMIVKSIEDLSQKQEQLSERIESIYHKDDFGKTYPDKNFSDNSNYKELEAITHMINEVKSKAGNLGLNFNEAKEERPQENNKENNKNVGNVANSVPLNLNSLNNISEEDREKVFKNLVDTFGLSTIKQLVEKFVERFPSLITKYNLINRSQGVHKLKRKRSASVDDDLARLKYNDSDKPYLGSEMFGEANSLSPLLQNSPNVSPIRLRKNQSTLSFISKKNDNFAVPIDKTNNQSEGDPKTESNPFDSLISANTSSVNDPNYNISNNIVN